MCYVTAGAGHRRAAEALAQAIRARDPQADVRCLEVFAEAPWLGRAYAWTYLLLVRRLARVWALAYWLLDQELIYRAVQPLRRRWNLRVACRFVRQLRALQPDAVLATHFLPADVCGTGRAAGWLRGPLVVVVTDLFPHRFWITPHADAMVAGTAEGAEALRARGVDPRCAHLIGIPVGSAFGATPDPAVLRQRLQLGASRRTVLVTSGGTTVGQFDEVVAALSRLEERLPGRLQLLVVCGENRRAAARLTALAAAAAMPMRVFGFVDYMADLMAVSDLIVCKAGGLTVSESLERGLPLVLYHVIPGQEQLNAAYVERHGAAAIATRPDEVAEVVGRVMSDPARLDGMRRAAEGLRRPDAAGRIVEQVLLPLLAQREAKAKR